MFYTHFTSFYTHFTLLYKYFLLPIIVKMDLHVHSNAVELLSVHSSKG